LIPPSLAAVTLPFPPSAPLLSTAETVGLALLALLFAGLFAQVRSALLHAVPSRVLARAQDAAERERLEPLLARADSLRTTASAYALASQLAFLVFVLAVALEPGFTLTRLGLGFAITVPLLVFVCELFPQSLRGPRHDALLVRFLPWFHLLHVPLAAPMHVLEVARRFTLRVFRIKEKPKAAREIVEGLRDVIEDSELEGDLGATTKEIIENAVEFHDVDVGEVMTPRTEIDAVDVEAGLDEVARVVAASGHGRLPVFEGGLDSMVGIVSAHDVIRALQEGQDLGARRVRAAMRPAVFVPETKLVSELLAEFRRDKQKMAVVLDEYGGTAGLVTMGDILAEIVGEMGDEFDEHSDDDVAHHADGTADVHASLRISEVNEELELDLPEEEDFETLAGFLLARFGRFPKPGETLVEDDVEYTVLEASDRRVLRVRVRRPAPQP